MKVKYTLYLASGIRLWKDYFRIEYSKYFNHKVTLFEPGTLDASESQRSIPIAIASYDFHQINAYADAMLVYMKHYTTFDGAPAGTDSAWECGYAIGRGKPVIVLIEDLDHVEFYVSQWMLTFSINAILTANSEVVKAVSDHPKFVHATLLFAEHPRQFETKIISYLNRYYASPYARMGEINYQVDKRARDLFKRQDFEKLAFPATSADPQIAEKLGVLDGREFHSENDILAVCRLEQDISDYFEDRYFPESLDAGIAAVIQAWSEPSEHILDCMEHSILSPFQKVPKRHQEKKKTRPVLFYELFHLVTHHLTQKQRFIRSKTFPYDVGAVIELYNWMNTYSIDDVFDNSQFRQGEKTVWFKFSRRDAIFTGILGHLLALRYCFVIASENEQSAEKMTSWINGYNRTMYVGQEYDTQLTLNTEEKKNMILGKNLEELCELNVRRIYGICGGFYEAIGGIAACVENKEEQVMNAKEIDEVSPRVGLCYGMIQMFRNDLADFIVVEEFAPMSQGMKGTSHSDITEGKMNFPYMLACYSEVLEETERFFLLSALHSTLGDKEKGEINRLLWKSGAVDLIEELIKRLVEYVEQNLLSKYHEADTRMRRMFSLLNITPEVVRPFKQLALEHRWSKYQYDQNVLEKLIKQIVSFIEEKRGY